MNNTLVKSISYELIIFISKHAHCPKGRAMCGSFTDGSRPEVALEREPLETMETSGKARLLQCGPNHCRCFMRAQSNCNHP